jgi:ferrous iron transport protein A
MTLQDIIKGKQYIIRSISSLDQALTSKILALGMIPGECIELMHKAPLGDPMQIKAGSTYISIRRKDGQFIEVDAV